MFHLIHRNKRKFKENEKIKEYIPNERTTTTKIPEQKPREMKIGNLLDKEFKVVVVKMLIELERKIEEHKKQILNRTKKLNNKIIEIKTRGNQYQFR